ncbi:hypothetical protein M0805_006281 [Coniferiporia weirii]|nr:hypothetical protein M0805_006281 [Coniferiporia weirii]
MNNDNPKHPQLIYLKRKLEDLEEVHRDGKRTHATEIEHLKSELERSRKTNKDQADHIVRLKKQCDSSESRSQDSRKTLLSNQLELKELRHKLRCVEQERDKLAGKHTDAAETRKALNAAEAKRKCDLQGKEKLIAELQRSLTVEKQKAAVTEAKMKEVNSTLEEELSEARTEKDVIEKNLRHTRALLRDAEANYGTSQQESASALDALDTQVSQLRESLTICAAEYGRLASSTISLAAYQSLKFDYTLLQLQMARLQRKLANSDDQVYELALLIRQTQATNALLLDQLREAEDELRWRLKESRFTSAYTSTPLTDDSLRSKSEALIVEERSCREEGLTQLRNIAQTQLDLYRLSGTQLIEHLTSTEHTLSLEQAELARQKAKLAEAEDLVVKLSSETELRKKELGELSSKNSAQVGEILAFQEKLKEKERALLSAENNAKAEIFKHNELLRKEREMTSRLHSTVQKSKMAEDALKAEIEQLSEELVGADAYREAYQNIAEEMRGLVARNSLAEDEAERLSKFNAEILGHRNPTQKIYYVDRIRRELSETKQKLAVSTRDHEDALSECAQLRNELGMYTSVAVPFEGKPRTNMTRVRRVPLGAQLMNVQTTEEDAYDTHIDLAQYLPDATIGNMTVEELS